MDKKIKSPFASWVWMPWRLLPAATTRWKQWGKTGKDALIAATALRHHLRLATRNLQHFTPIEG